MTSDRPPRRSSGRLSGRRSEPRQRRSTEPRTRLVTGIAIAAGAATVVGTLIAVASFVGIGHPRQPSVGHWNYVITRYSDRLELLITGTSTDVSSPPDEIRVIASRVAGAASIAASSPAGSASFEVSAAATIGTDGNWTARLVLPSSIGDSVLLQPLLLPIAASGIVPTWLDDVRVNGPRGKEVKMAFEAKTIGLNK